MKRVMSNLQSTLRHFKPKASLRNRLTWVKSYIHTTCDLQINIPPCAHILQSISSGKVYTHQLQNYHLCMSQKQNVVIYTLINMIRKTLAAEYMLQIQCASLVPTLHGKPIVALKAFCQYGSHFATRRMDGKLVALHISRHTS